MGQNVRYVKRDKLDILLGILDIASTSVKKTHILYKANINFYQLTRYLDLLKHLEMLEEVSEPFNGYRITEKGRQMLNLFNHVPKEDSMKDSPAETTLDEETNLVSSAQSQAIIG